MGKTRPIVLPSRYAESSTDISRYAMPGTETFANGFFVSRCAIAGTDIRVFLGNVADAVSGWEAEDG